MRLFLLMVFMIGITTNAHADYCERVVDAIYKAEGGKKAKVPYGVLSVKTDDPRQTCLEVVRWHHFVWSNSDHKYNLDFIEYLSHRYAPIGAKNDPFHLNRHWVKNVNYFMEKSK